MWRHWSRTVVLLTLLNIAGCGGAQPIPTTQQNPFGNGAGQETVTPTLAAAPAVGTNPGRMPPQTTNRQSPGSVNSSPAATPGTTVPPATPAPTTGSPDKSASAPMINSSPQPGPRPGPVGTSAASQNPSTVAVKPVTPNPPPVAPERTTDSTPADSAADWPQFRGPGGSGRAETADPPVKWSETENVVFVAPLEGAGSSSPVILGHDLYLTEAIAVGVDPKRAGRPASVQRYIVCLDAQTGEQRWRTEIGTDTKSPALNGYIARHGYTSSTPICDGLRVFAYFGHVGLSAVEADGTVVGTKPLGTKLTQLGCWASPILHGGNIILNGSVEGAGLLALDADGNEVWSRSKVKGSAASPLIVRTADGAEELVFSGQDEIVGLNPETGEELWRADGIPETVHTSPIAQDGVVYFSGGKSGTTIALRTGGRGDVTYSHRVWKNKEGAEYASPVWHDGRLFLAGQDGRVTALVAETGQLAGHCQLPDATIFATPLVAAGRLYIVTREGGVYVLSADEKLEVLAHNRIADDDTPFNASPAAVGSRIYLRSNKAVYCFSQDN